MQASDAALKSSYYSRSEPCIAAENNHSCPLWVIHDRCVEATRACLSAFARKRTNGSASWDVVPIATNVRCRKKGCYSITSTYRQGIAVNNDIVFACPWADWPRALGNLGSGCKTRGCPRSLLGCTVRGFACCNRTQMSRRPDSYRRTTVLRRLRSGE
jgi:hypothetical protein